MGPKLEASVREYKKLKEIRKFLHGGDYNPDQWLDRPDVLEDDIRLMKEAHINTVTLGVFAWSSLEPREGEFCFGWLDEIMDKMYENGIHVILSTPSGARPPWMAKKYSEVMRTDENRVRQLYGGRENHCESSPVWREKVRIMDEKLAERYARHPALILWHLSNELYGQCYCDKCAANFRRWLRRKYGTIENLNRQYWSAFWSHGYTDFDEIDPPSRHGEMSLHALVIDYRRFYSELQTEFIAMERQAVQKYNPEIPVTTNMHNINCVDYDKLAHAVDVISWDSYPRWHCQPDKTTEWENAAGAAFTFDYARALKQKPFYLMESAPGVPSQFEFCKLKRPGMHMLSSLLPISCGSESVQYFQWRMGDGASEKFHGAVIDHSGSGGTRVFADVREVGRKLLDLAALKGSGAEADVALIYDYDNMQGLSEKVHLRRDGRFFTQLPFDHYGALLKNYVNVDVISAEADFSRYRVIAAPALYLFRPDTAAKIRTFVAGGGSFVLTFYSGLVNENDLCFSGTLAAPAYAPHDLNGVFGLRVKEIDGLCDDEENEIVYGGKRYAARVCCEIVEVPDEAGAEAAGAVPAESAVSAAEAGTAADVLATYQRDFYAGSCAASVHSYGKGRAYYIACHTDGGFLQDFYRRVLEEAGVAPLADGGYVKDVMVRERGGRLFVMNFSTGERTICVGGQTLTLKGYGYAVL